MRNNRSVNQKLREVMNTSGIMNNPNLQNMVNSPDVKRAVNSLSDAQKNALLEEFSKLSTDDIRRKLQNVNTRELSGLSAEQMIQKLRRL